MQQLCPDWEPQGIISCEPHDDPWKQSIQRNNEAIASFLQGKLAEAHGLFMEASVLKRLASNDESNDSREYRCKWISIDQSTSLIKYLNLSGSHNHQNGMMSHVFKMFLHIQHEEASESADEVPPMAPDVFVAANIHWAMDFNHAVASQLIGIILPNEHHQGMYLRALSFDLYELIERDIVDWYDEDGYAPLPVAILLVAIYNNQGAMFCQLGVQNQVENYWGRMRRIRNRSSHLFGKHLVCSLFQHNLDWLRANSIRAASAA